MAKSYKTPGVYIEEIPKFPVNIEPQETAVPAFVGFTEKDEHEGKSLLNIPALIKNITEFENIFGRPKPQHVSVVLDSNNQLANDVIVEPLLFNLHHSLQLYFANGGGKCFISTAGIYPATIEDDIIYTALSNALEVLENETSVTLIILPDALLSGEDNFYLLHKQALSQASRVTNRFALVDLYSITKEEKFSSIEKNFREKIGNDNLYSGAAYFPYLQTSLEPYVEEQHENIVISNITYKLKLPDDASAEELTYSLYHTNKALYDAIKSSIANSSIILAPSAAIAGIFCTMDNTRGVWKAPANVSLVAVQKPMLAITDEEQSTMNVHETGKSVNAIRYFTGKGILVWGARTLKGNDNEWRYIPVRRLFGFVEGSVKAAVETFVFEPNDANTWVKVSAMIENFLVGLWRQGALLGNKPEQSFYVKIGLNKTMTAVDILEGRMILEIGLAPVRPAEFIISRMSFMMMET